MKPISEVIESNTNKENLNDQLVITSVDQHTLKETSQYFDYAYPYRTVDVSIDQYPQRLFSWHWHDEIEINYVKAGILQYSTVNEVCTLYPGDVCFINSNVIHHIKCMSNDSCIINVHAFLPQFISGSFDNNVYLKYIAPVINNEDIKIIVFKSNEPSALKIKEYMDYSYHLFYEHKSGYEINTRNQISQIWLFVYHYVIQLDKWKTNHNDIHQQRIKELLIYISQHYQEKITLEELSKYVHISPKECYRCFKTTLKETPFEYILHYRINKACDLLKDSNLSMIEIGMNCGFTSPSYFTKTFKSIMSMTPSEYRKKHFDKY